MKAFCVTIVALSLSCLHASAAAAENASNSYEGTQVGIIRRIEQLSRDGKYDDIYEILAPEYTSGLTEDRFVEVSRKLSWKLENLHTGTLEEYPSISYMPVRAVVLRRGQLPVKVDVVVFFKKAEKGWMLINFPFMTPDFPSFTSIPEWFMGTFSGLP